MFKRIASIFHTETEEEFQMRMKELDQDLEGLRQKQPEEVAGTPEEALYYSLHLGHALDAGEQATARRLVSEMLRASPTDAHFRLMAAAAFGRMGDEAEAVAQLGVGLALAPDNFALHSALARRLLARGDTSAAEAVLEVGWGYYRTHLTKRDQQVKRAEYFSVLQQDRAA